MAPGRSSIGDAERFVCLYRRWAGPLELAAIRLGLFPAPGLRALSNQLPAMRTRDPFGTAAAAPVFVLGFGTVGGVARVNREHETSGNPAPGRLSRVDCTKSVQIRRLDC